MRPASIPAASVPFFHGQGHHPNTVKRLTRLSFSIALLLCGCGKASSDPAMRERELAYLRCLMPEALLSYANLDVPGIENITAVRDETAGPHLEFRLFPGQRKLHGGIRAEASIDFPFQEGDTIRYAWEFRVAPDFQPDPDNRWWIMGQWHDQPNVTTGETWKGFPSRSPPVLLGIGQWQGRLAFGFEYGPTQDQKLGPFFIKPSEWHRIALVIHWSQGQEGKAALYVDDLDRPAAEARGPNMHNAMQHYLKLGMYRHPGIQTDNRIAFRSLDIRKVRQP